MGDAATCAASLLFALPGFIYLFVYIYIYIYMNMIVVKAISQVNLSFRAVSPP